MTRKRSAETDVERLEEEGRLTLKRKAEVDPNDSEVENTVMNSLAELRREDNDPGSEIDLLIFFSSVIATLQACTGLALTSQCVRSPKHFSHMMSVDGIVSTTRVASCSTTLLSRKRGLRKFRSFVSLVLGRLSIDPVVRTRWVDINKGHENKPFFVSRLVVQEYKRQADWSFFTPTPPLEALRSFFENFCGASCGSVHGQQQSWPFAWEHVWLQRRWSELGIRDLQSPDRNWLSPRKSVHRHLPTF